MAQHDRLSDAEVSALREALDDEYKAVATYDRVLADFGEVGPFTNIVEAERRHVRALAAVFDRYGLPLPANTWGERAPRYESIRAACSAGVEGEIENGAMYDRLIAVTTHTDIIEVFENLRRASQENHLAAFRRCVARHDGEAAGDDVDNTERRGGMRRRRRHRGGPSS
jgi:hypothetical protein